MPKKRIDLPEVLPLEELARIEWIQSTVPAINAALGGNGLPMKGVVEVFGAPTGGKTTVALTFLPDLYVDMEHSLDPVWALHFVGGRTQVSQPESLEQAFGLIERTLISRPRAIALDSLGGSLSEQEIDSNQKGALSSATSRWLRLLNNQGKLDHTCLIVVNQLRSSFSAYGPPTTTPGGFLFHHLALMRVSVKKSGVIEVGERKVGQEVLLQVIKSKVGVPWSEGSAFLGYNGKFYESEEALKVASRLKGRAKDGSAGESPAGGGAGGVLPDGKGGDSA